MAQRAWRVAKLLLSRNVIWALTVVFCATTGLSQDNGSQDIPDAVVKKVDPSVVAIQHKRAAGSGFVISADGYILSNGHVVMGDDSEDPTKPAQSITVILNDERKYPARVLGFCMNPDVALLKIEPDEPLHPVTFADSRAAQIGQKCFAVGTPVGLKRTFTSGILSNVDRTDLGTFTKVFQTDAAINPGNSGGPLFDQEGRVLGINTYASQGSNNLGFTIPSYVVNLLKEHIQKYGRFRRVDLPLLFAGELYDELATAMGVEKGILVTYVMPGTSAEQAGIRRGDIITAIDGKACSARTRAELMEFEWEFVTREPGSAVELTVLRGEAGNRKEVVIKAKLELDEPMPFTGRFPGEVITHYYDALGLGFKGILRLHRAFYGLPDETGVLVSLVANNQPAQKADLTPGVIIAEVGGVSVDSVESFQRELEKHLRACKKAIDLRVQRGNTSFKTALVPYYDMKDKRAALVLPPGEVSALELIVREMVADGAAITIVTVDGTKPAAAGSAAVMKLADTKGSEFDLLLFPDGDAAPQLWDNADALRIIREAYAAQKILAAIGSASITLVAAEPELLGKKMTTVKNMSGEAVKRKAHYTGSDLEKDGTILTATGFDRKGVREFLKALRLLVRNAG